MIHIDLRPRKERRRWPWFAVLGAVVGLAGGYWLDQRYPLEESWRKLWTRSLLEDRMEQEVENIPLVFEPVPAKLEAAEEGGAPSPEAGIPDTAEAKIEGEAQGALALEELPQSAPLPEEIHPPGAKPEEVPSQPPEVEIVASRKSAVETPAADRSRLQPPWSAVCLQLVELANQLPAAARLMALTCNAAGEYTLEGTSLTPEEVEAFWDTLKQLPSRVALSWWRGGKRPAEEGYRYHFAFQGQCENLPVREPEVLSPSQARVVFQKIASWAQQSGLGDLSVAKPLEMSFAPDHLQFRQKVWATGSPQQIGTFLHQLKQVEATAILGEVVVVPVQEGNRPWEKARLYAAIDALVRQP